MSQNNPFSDAFKVFDAWKNVGKQVPAFDSEEVSNLVRKNIEVAQQAQEAFAEGAQTIIKRQLEIAQANAEGTLELFKVVASSKDPRESAAKQADFAKTAFEKAAVDANELADIAAKSSNKVAEIIGKQVSDNLKETTKTQKKAASKAAPKAA